MPRPASASALIMPLLAGAFAVPAATQAAPKPVPKHMVRFSFKEGTVRHSVLTMDVSSKAKGGNKDAETVMQTTVWMTTTVKSTNGNIAQLEQVFTRIKAAMDGPGGKFESDSDDRDSDPGPLASAVRNLVDQKVRFKLNDTGKQSDVELPKADEQTTRNVKGWHQTMLQGLSPLPAHPIAIHDGWRVTGKSLVPVICPAELEVTTATELLAVDKTSVTVKQTQTVAKDQELPGAMKAQDIEIGGTHKLDLRTGIPIESTMTTKTKTSGMFQVEMIVKQTIKPAPAPKAKAKAKSNQAKEPARQANR